jgi:hypothetical protein
MKSLLFFLFSIHLSFAGDYAIVVSQKTAANESWSKVVSTLQEKHDAQIIRYENSVKESLSPLKKLFPRHACFVATPHETTKDFVRAIHLLSRQLDDDPYADLFWGILSGYDAENALLIARTNKPLIIRNSLACTEIELDRCERGKWFCELKRGHGVTKGLQKKAETIELPQDTTSLFVKELNQGKPDLFVTSGHATEKDLQLGYAYRNGVFRNKSDGSLYGSDLSGRTHTVSSPNPKIYMPIGNCLMGHLRGPDSMAAAFMKSAAVRQMMGYVEVTWYGYMGWGCLDYFVEQPGRYSFNQAFFANHHALIHRLETCFPGSNDTKQSAQKISSTVLAQKLRLGRQDLKGLLFDRDIVAFYGDPAWQARMAEGKTNWIQKLSKKKDSFVFTVTPTNGPDSFKPVNTNGVQRGYRPFIEFFDRRLPDMRIISGAEYNPVITDTFILVPNPPSKEEAKSIRIIFQEND